MTWRHHRHSLHQRGVRHSNRPQCRWIRFRPHAGYTLPILASACANMIAAGIVAGTSKAS